MDLSGEIINRLDHEGIIVNDYINDDVVKSLVSDGFGHDWIIGNIAKGDITLKSRYTVKEETVYDEKKAGEHEREAYEAGKKKGEKEEEDELEKNKKRTVKDEIEYDENKARKHRERDYKEGEKAGKEEVKEEMEKSFSDEIMKSFNSMKEMVASIIDEKFAMLEKSMQSQVNELKNQPGSFKTVPHAAYLEKSMGVNTNSEGKKVLNVNNPSHREAIKSVLSKSFSEEKDMNIKKSLGEDILTFGLSGSNNISQEGMNVLRSAGIVIE